MALIALARFLLLGFKFLGLDRDTFGLYEYLACLEIFLFVEENVTG